MRLLGVSNCTIRQFKTIIVLSVPIWPSGPKRQWQRSRAHRNGSATPIYNAQNQGPHRRSMMNATRVYSLLQAACRALEDAGEHAISAYVGLVMAMINEKYGVGQDHLDQTDRE